jgi:hypothetical protein
VQLMLHIISWRGMRPTALLPARVDGVEGEPL